jgi:hypothetical protein
LVSTFVSAGSIAFRSHDEDDEKCKEAKAPEPYMVLHPVFGRMILLHNETLYINSFRLYLYCFKFR